jgi:hypothetical protein
MTSEKRPKLCWREFAIRRWSHQELRESEFAATLQKIHGSRSIQLPGFPY